MDYQIIFARVGYKIHPFIRFADDFDVRFPMGVSFNGVTASESVKSECEKLANEYITAKLSAGSDEDARRAAHHLRSKIESRIYQLTARLH